jgi:hypothetical protein
MDGSTPAELRSDAWVIRQNALRLLAACRSFLDHLDSAAGANLASRVEARVEHGVSESAVGLTAIDGIGSGRASRLAAEGLQSPADVREAGVDGLIDAGLSSGVAERVVESARALPALDFDWGAFPERIAPGENEMCEVTVTNAADGARAGVRVTVNGIEMTETDSYLGSVTVPVGVFGGDADALEFAVEVSFPDLPLQPVVDTRTVAIE